MIARELSTLSREAPSRGRSEKDEQDKGILPKRLDDVLGNRRKSERFEYFFHVAIFLSRATIRLPITNETWTDEIVLQQDVRHVNVDAIDHLSPFAAVLRLQKIDDYSEIVQSSVRIHHQAYPSKHGSYHTPGCVQFFWIRLKRDGSRSSDLI